MTDVSATSLASLLDDKLAVQQIGIDDFSSLRHLHASAMRAQTLGVLSDEELTLFVQLVYAPEYMDMLAREAVYGGWLNGELVGTVSWHAAGSSGTTASIGGIFVRHRRLGIGRRLLATAEGQARQSGFERISACATANAVPFFLRLGYETASRGVRTMPRGCTLPVTFVRKLLPRPRSALN